MPSGTIYELSVDQEIGGNQICNVHHFEQQTGDLGQDPREELVDAYQLAVEADQLACQSDDLSIVGYRCRAIFPVETQTFEQSTAEPGTRAGESMPANSPAVVAWYTEEGSPIRVGRTFLAGILEGDVFQGLLEEPIRTLLIAFGNSIVAQIESTDELQFKKVLYKALDDSFLAVITGEPRARLMKLGSRTKGVGQ